MARPARVNLFFLSAGYLFYASMVGTGSSALASYTPEKGAAGTQVSGTWIIDSGGQQAVMTDNTDGRLFTFDATGANDSVIISCDFASDNWAQRFPGLLVRYTASTDHFLFQIQTNMLILYECVGGGYVSRATSGVLAPVNGTFYTIAATLNGTSITGAISALGTSINYTSSNNQSSTKFGLRFGGSTPTPSNATFWKQLFVRPL